MTVRYGLTLSSEEHSPRRLVDMAELAESHGFDFVSVSDHYHPWVDAQGHSPLVWSVLGAIAERTSTLDIAVGVTCPIMRIHPAVLAQATATTAHLLEGRFTWGVGTGEALNEHILGDRWPPAPQRLEMLDEAIALIRDLWTGEQITFRGAHFVVENARLYDPPPSVVPVVVSAFGPKAAAKATTRRGLHQPGATTSSRRCRDHHHRDPLRANPACRSPGSPQAPTTGGGPNRRRHVPYARGTPELMANEHRGCRQGR